ncbi:histidine phosphatase family protein [Lacimicrobium alkaliphilum]|uniref:Histidine phosphatase family protein n=1 Tax=Lacimicrobium alkaliphilum TaxID=1526571 RepID=A0ABQ1R910_9ALTE|nr:histidine phosphatase family protein [Lacimicrobium alkaliphilum]GGD60606.1 histidine phosphatase family protein [Lacimicrobium alkaliphilum]
MSVITLVRHGQASFGCKNYDQLSALGKQQSVWLGEHWQQLDRRFDHVITGNMHRHHQTASGILQGLADDALPEPLEGLNEYNFEGLLTPLKQQHPGDWIDTGRPRKDYYYNMKHALDYWARGTIEDDGTDSWSSFNQRVTDSFHRICDGEHKKPLIVSSGGVIATIISALLGLRPAQAIELSLQIKNTAVSTFLYNGKDFSLTSFNDLSHLLSPDKQSHITYS